METSYVDVPILESVTYIAKEYFGSQEVFLYYWVIIFGNIMAKEFNQMELGKLIKDNVTSEMEEEWDQTDEVDEDERKQKWLSDLREEIEQDNLDMSEPMNSNNEQNETKYDTLDFSEEGVYEDLVGTAEDRAEYYMNQSIIAYEEEQLNQTQEHLNEEAEEEICFELADDKEFKKTIEDNDEFNERNNPIFID